MGQQTDEIKDLEEVLTSSKNSGKKITSISCTALTAPGENYGSKILSVILTLDGKETLNLVAKLPPPNEWIKKMFQVHVTFKKEIGMYERVFPSLKRFQEKRGVEKSMDFYPRFYGGRISLDPGSKEVDDDAVLLLENVSDSGFEIVDRMVGFDLETTELIVKELAVFHAVPIAMKLEEPQLFEECVGPYVKKLAAFDAISEEVKSAMVVPIITALKENPKCADLVDRVVKAFELAERCSKDPPQIREPFATINHCDYWVNNVMVKFQCGKPVAIKMVDFQLIEWGSPARDFIFLIFSSVRKSVVDQNYDALVELYYKTLIETLYELKCDAAHFTFEAFKRELDIEAKTSQFSHVMIMMKPIYAPKGSVRNLDEMSEEDLIDNDSLTDAYKRRVCENVMEFAKRGWI